VSVVVFYEITLDLYHCKISRENLAFNQFHWTTMKVYTGNVATAEIDLQDRK